EPRGLRETGQRLLPGLRIAEHADEDPRQPLVRRQLHARHRDEADARVLELARDQLRHVLADLLGHPRGAPLLHRNSVCASSSWISRACSASPTTLCSVDSRCSWSVLTETTASRARCHRSWCSTSAI